MSKAGETNHARSEARKREQEQRRLDRAAAIEAARRILHDTGSQDTDKLNAWTILERLHAT